MYRYSLFSDFIDFIDSFNKAWHAQVIIEESSTDGEMPIRQNQINNDNSSFDEDSNGNSNLNVKKVKNCIIIFSFHSRFWIQCNFTEQKNQLGR